MRTKHFLAVAAATASTLSAAQAATVYDNTTGDLNTRLVSNNIEIGDQVTLAGTDRLLSLFSFQFFATGLSGGETARVRIYANNGAVWNPSFPSILEPGTTPLYDSGPFSLWQTNRDTMVFSVAGGQLPNNILLPDTFTFSVQFSGIAGAEAAGVDLYNPPGTGSSFNDYWYNDAGGVGWDLKTNTTSVLNFAAHFEAVPEPSFWSLCIVGGICGFFLVRRRSARS